MYAKLIQRIEATGAVARVADGAILVHKGHCFAQRTLSGWMLYRRASDERGRFFSEFCSDEEALHMLGDGEVPRETESLSNREVARRVLSEALRELVGTDGPQAELLFEALDCLAS